MARGSTLRALLEGDDEPNPKSYKETIENTIKDPQQISCLTEEDVRDDVLIVLTTHSPRLAQFFRLLCSTVRTTAKSPSTSKIAAETVTLLVDVLPDLLQLLGPTKVLDLLLPALDVCLVSSQRPKLRELASVLASSGTLLEHLVSHHTGIEIIRQWVSMQSIAALDVETLGLWTERLVSMVGSCEARHDFAQTIQQFRTLRDLKSHLQDLEARQSGEPSGPIAQQGSLPLGNMTQLSKDDKKTRTGAKEPKTNEPTLDENIKSALKVLDLPNPESWAAVWDVIEKLEGNETVKALVSVLTHFPCDLCTQGTGSSPRSPDARTLDANIEKASNLQIEILGRALWVWQVVLSEKAFRSLQEMSVQGSIKPFGERLKDLASGNWKSVKSKLTGTKAQRKPLKIPLFATKYGKNKFILWQVDIGTARDLQVPEQIIKVWEVGGLSEMDTVFDRVALFQGNYSPESIRRCCHRLIQGKTTIPARFEDLNLHSATTSVPAARLDVRTVDQGTIDMANKFYAVTEPMYHAILANDLSAEFPLSLSEEETRVVSHCQTASLILGRSGTGKTTCLIFKLVGKYLTSKTVMGERPVKQVLLTKSGFLADKLRTYTQELIKTLESKPADQQTPTDDKDPGSMTPQEDLEEGNVSVLRERSFPLVLTFDEFLEDLENITEAFERTAPTRPEARFYQNPANFEKTAKVKHWQQSQRVDFSAFKLDYWPHFPQTLTKKLGVNLVFAEIMGVIKGSASSGHSLAPLSGQQYLARSCRLAPIFVMEDDRALVYDVFEKYERMKEERQDVDIVDRVVKLIRSIRRNASLKQFLESSFDEVYIDEVQDLRCVDIQLLLEFIKDSRGLHFAGDTAQAISQDSTFRFSDVKAIIYEHFAAASAHTNQSQLARTTMFTLSKNYRSHQGILALASLVMSMMWKGFPETIDKLEPEVGDLNGPKPVFFLGCDASILHTSNVGLVNLSDRVADFGAEQVILVRDEFMKAKLQGEIGNIALILTISDSKGMEFDDVIVWDFFTSSPDPSGVRRLNALTTDARATFDVQRHSGMYLELKNLYVATTRARIHLFFIEGSQKATSSVVDLLTSGSSGSLIDVARPHEEDFPEKLRMLRPGTSVDPVRWSLKGDDFMRRENYEVAVWCFHKAKNQQGEKVANAKLFEAKGRKCKSENDIQGFTQNFEAAIELFKETKMISDAANTLEVLTRFEDAAELWLKHDETGKAALLFAKAGLYVRASDCHDEVGNHSEAAAILRQGAMYNEMVSYLTERSGKLSVNNLRSYSLLCKLLLKKEKLSSECHIQAIRLLGSSAEQEACFIEYGMDDELAELYASQMRHQDLFHLHCRKGQLERALGLAITKDLLQCATDTLESEVLSLLDYVWAGHQEKNRLQRSASYKLPTGFLSPSVIHRAKQWEASNLAYGIEGAMTRQHAASMKDTEPKTVLCLRKILSATTIAQVTSLDDLPFEMMQEAIMFVKSLTVDKDNDSLKTLFILTGLWKPRNVQQDLIPLPWSPLRPTLTNVSNIDPTKFAMQWALDRLVSAILALDAKARDLWTQKWPKRCIHYSTMGFCPRQRNKEHCNWLHQSVSQQDCSEVVEDLLRVNSIFCDLAILYYRRSMNGTFQEKYLGIKRYWLERLLRELTHLSAVEQHTTTITKTQAELCHDKNYTAILSSLEELLYLKLGKDWNERSDFTSLLEQMRHAQAFGSNLPNRVFRALSYKLHADGRGQLQSQLGLWNTIEQINSGQDASVFQSNLITFLRNLDGINVRAFSTLHALTAVFEYLAAYLILKVCDAACVLTQAWIDLYVPRFTDAIHSVEPLQWFERKHKYQQCLMELTKAFCGILRRLNEVPQPGITLLCSGKPHPPLLFRQRNAELVAIVVANLAPTEPRGFSQFWSSVKEVFEYDFIRAYHLRSSTSAEIMSKLASSFSKYNGKDALVVVSKHRKMRSLFSSFEHQPGVKTAGFDQICPPRMNTATVHVPAHGLPSTSTDSPQEEYTTTEMEAAIKVQRLWRICLGRIKNRHLYMQLPEARAIARFISLSAECPATLTFVDGVTFRDTLLSKGVATSLRLAIARDTLSKLRKDATACVENVDISTKLFESVDEVLQQNSQVQLLLKEADDKMTDENLLGVVKIGMLDVMEEVLKDVEEIVTKAEQGMLETRKVVDAVSRSFT